MKTEKTLFQSIQETIAWNEVNNNGKQFVIYQTTPHYPTGVLKFLVNNKILEIKNVDKSYDNGFKFKVTYKNLNEDHKFLKRAIKSLEYENYKKDCRARERAIKTMTFREEFECPNWSNIEDETGYMACPNNTGGFEMIEPEDSCITQFALSELGYDTYQDFVNDNTGVPISELKEQMYEQLRAFQQQKCARDWQIGEDEE